MHCEPQAREIQYGRMAVHSLLAKEVATEGVLLDRESVGFRRAARIAARWRCPRQCVLTHDPLLTPARIRYGLSPAWSRVPPAVEGPEGLGRDNHQNKLATSQIHTVSTWTDLWPTKEGQRSSHAMNQTHRGQPEAVPPTARREAC